MRVMTPKFVTADWAGDDVSIVNGFMVPDSDPPEFTYEAN